MKRLFCKYMRILFHIVFIRWYIFKCSRSPSLLFKNYIIFNFGKCLKGIDVFNILYYKNFFSNEHVISLKYKKKRYSEIIVKNSFIFLIFLI